ncbi:MAG: hypothetical protein QNJ41_03820 [Xenococcaceae cyanobacterium MO_188.B32]|nr:hypothetical protein [Xenococcaceae cyanobacterium MO_188.B32]
MSSKFEVRVLLGSASRGNLGASQAQFGVKKKLTLLDIPVVNVRLIA